MSDWSNYTFYQIQDIAESHWDDFGYLLRFHGDALKSRRTPYAKDLKAQIEDRLTEIIHENWKDRQFLETVEIDLLNEEAEFALVLRIDVRKRLIELRNDSFRFPTTRAEIGYGEISIHDWQEDGLLSAAGYVTGRSGLERDSRIKILESLYLKGIPRNTGVKNIEEWGMPRTATRLKKLVDSLASFTRQEKRNWRGDYSISISERELDLKFLKKTYYDGVYDLKWRFPHT